MTLFQYFWRFIQICKKLAAFALKIVFVIVFEHLYYRNNNKNNFASKCCKFLANLCKSSAILKQYDVKCWLNYRIYGYVSHSHLAVTKQFEKLFTVPVPGSGRSKRIFWHHLVHDSGLSQCFWKSVICLTIKDIWWDLEDSEDPEFCTIKYWIGTQRNIKANWTCSRWNGIFTNFLVSMQSSFN